MKKLLIILNMIFLPTLAASELNSVFSEGVNLTDEQVTQSKDFVHQGIKDKVYTDGCKDLKNCQTEEDNGIENVIGKVYATALPLVLSQVKGGGSKGKSDKATTDDAGSEATAKSNTNTTETAQTDNKTATEKKEDGTDWCIIAAMGYEMFSSTLQDKLQKKSSKSEQDITDPQLRTLVNLRETHKSRKKSATYQATAYGTVTACYAVSMATGQLTKSWQNGVKMGGAALLTTLYMKKASKHAKLAGKVQKVIDALPKSGVCNPWTESACFCQEATSKELYPAEYQEVCVLNNGDFNTPKMAMGCAVQDSSGKVTNDEKCRCKQTNSCLSARFSAFTPTLSGAANLTKQMQAGFDLLDSGFYDEAKLNSYSTQAAAMGSKLARQISNPDSQAIALTNDQKKLAKELSSLVAPELAAMVAKASPEFPENSIASSGGSLSSLSAKEKKEDAAPVHSNVKYKASGATNNSFSDDSQGFAMPNLLGKKQASSSSIEVLNFAEKAVSNADVNNTPDTPIFDIISNRYRHAWKRLE